MALTGSGDRHDAGGAVPTSPLAADFPSLLSQWTVKRRAQGGWWALAGFSFQTALYLLRFFEGLRDGTDSTALLATTELLSDILIPRDAHYELIQVKRTLDRTKLKAALREAYEVASLCHPQLLERLRFHIACVKNTTSALPRDFTVDDIVESGGNPDLWERLLKCFPSEPIITEPDPLGRLYDLLCYCGVHDPIGFIDSTTGILLQAFEDPSPFRITRLAQELSRAFHFARADASPLPTRIGQMITAEELRPNAESAADTGILFNRRPQLRDLKLGRVRKRPTVFSTLVERFNAWWDAVAATEEVSRVPIFWIGGRSGEGKSVLLLQLVQHLLTDHHTLSVTYLSSANELPHWLSEQASIQRRSTGSASFPPIAVVDDLHLIRNREEWLEATREATELLPPRVAVLGCGPTPELRIFESTFSTVAEVQDFIVPNLTLSEMIDFGTWHSQRVGRPFEIKICETDNRLLVIWMFELIQDKSVREFAGNFRRRLAALDLFGLAYAIVAANALELPAATGLLDALSDSQRDVFTTLCSETQLHFEYVREEGMIEGYRLSHPQINWALFCEWALPPATIAQEWGRALAKSVISAIRNSNTNLAHAYLYRAGIATQLSANDEDSNARVGTHSQTLEGLYKKLNTELSLQEADTLMPRWLELSFRASDLTLTPNPVDQVMTRANSTPQDVSPYSAGWLWRIGETERFRDRRDAFHGAAASILLAAPLRPGTEATVSVIASKSLDREAALRLCKEWIHLGPTRSEAYRAISTLVAAWPRDEDILNGARRWLAANPRHPHAYHVIAPLISARPADDEVVKLAMEWVENTRRSNMPVGYAVLEPLLAARPKDDKVRAAALEWIADNLAHPTIYQLLAPLIATRTQDVNAINLALDWAKNNTDHPRAYYVMAALASSHSDDIRIRELSLKWVQDNLSQSNAYLVLLPLVANRPRDEAVIATAIKWVGENKANSSIHSLLSSMVARRPDDTRVVQAAVDWVQANKQHPQVYNLIMPLVAAFRGNEKIIALAMDWLANNLKHPKYYQLLSGLVAARRNDDAVVKIALKWTEDNPHHSKAYWLLAPIVAARPSDDSVIEIALRWLADNTSHPEILHLMLPLIAARPTDERILEQARRWFERNQGHPNAHTMLDTLIKRTSGATEWMTKAEDLFATAQGAPHRILLLALLVGSKLRETYLEQTLKEIDCEGDKRIRDSLLIGLSRALSNNIENSLGYLSGTSSDALKVRVAHALANGLSNYPDRADDFLKIIDSTPQEYVGLLLAGCVKSIAKTERLNPILVKFLNQEKRDRGYGLVLRALRQRPDRWHELENLSERVVEDYEKLK